jgi:hypothetical protein
LLGSSLIFLTHSSTVYLCEASKRLRFSGTLPIFLLLFQRQCPDVGHVAYVLSSLNISHFGITEKLLGMQILRPRLALLNQNLHFNKIPRCFVGTLKVEEALASMTSWKQNSQGASLGLYRDVPISF